MCVIEKDMYETGAECWVDRASFGRKMMVPGVVE